MRDQLRIYELQPGVFEEFFEYWKANIVPAREACGFSVPSAWHEPETNQFIWTVRYHGEGSFEDADQAYYDSPLRSKVPKSSGKFVASSKVLMVETLDPFVATR